MSKKPENASSMDITLSYQALGLTFRATPADVEKAYARIMGDLNTKLKSLDTVTRLSAKEDIELFTSIYENIKKSVTYSDSVKEMEKLERNAAAKDTEPDAELNLKLKIKLCPACKKTIHISARICPYCKTELVAGLGKLGGTIFTPRNMLILIALLVIAAAAIFATLYSGLLKSPSKQPPADIPASGGFSNLSAATLNNYSGFANHSSAATKP